jgi:hypothetical protein
MPAYQLEVLIQYLPSLEASELRDQITATVAPHTKPYAFRTLMRSLSRLAAKIESPPPPEPPRAYVELDREKARAWFEQQGVRVVRREEVESA